MPFPRAEVEKIGAKALPTDKIPTVQNVLEAFQHVRRENPQVSDAIISQELSEQLIKIVNDGFKSDVAADRSNIKKVLLKIKKERDNWMRHKGRSVTKETMTQKLQEPVGMLVVKDKVPVEYQSLLKDQLGEREYSFITYVPETTVIQDTPDLVELEEEIETSQSQPISGSQSGGSNDYIPPVTRGTNTETDEFEMSQSQPVNFSQSSGSSDYIPPVTRGTNLETGEFHFPENKPEILGEAVDRLDLSPNAVAFIVNAFLESRGVEDYKLSPGYVRCALEKARQARLEEQVGMKVEMIGFDGKREDSSIMVRDPESGRVYFEKKRMDNISVIKLPENRYIGSTVAENGSGKGCKDAIVSLFNKREIIFRPRLVQSDGTGVNTGHENGAISLLEEEFESPVQWVICFLHHLDLPLLALVEFYFGEGRGPRERGFTGYLGEVISGEELHKQPVVAFEAIKPEDELPILEASSLNKDQYTFIRLLRAVVTGKCPKEDSALRMPVLSSVRWLSCATRILRAYISIQEPPEAMKRLVEYVCKVYGPMWLKAKHQPNLVNGAGHLFEEMKRIENYCTEEEKQILQPSVQRNSYFAHSENLLLSLLGSDELEDREFAVRQILKIRRKEKEEEKEKEKQPEKQKKKQKKSKKVRAFKIPTLQWGVDEARRMIKEEDFISQPPLLMDVSDDTVNSFIDRPWSTDLVCHSQAVEKAVQLTSSKTRLIGENKDAAALNTEISRRNRPQMRSLADYS